MPKYYLYIPFTNNGVENSTLLHIQAIDWCQTISESDQPQRTPTIIIHGKDKFAAVEDKAIIYVLGHGIHNRNIIINTSIDTDPSARYLSMRTVAERMINDGLTPAMNARIKLFFCGQKNYAKRRALKFIDALGSRFYKSSTTVDYYDTDIYSPEVIRPGSIKTVKWAQKMTAKGFKLLKTKDVRTRIVLSELEPKEIEETKEIKAEAKVVVKREFSYAQLPVFFIDPAVIRIGKVIGRVEQDVICVHAKP